MRKVSGFTIIELVAVILILGILAAVAVPQVVSLQTEAKQAVLKGVAGAVAAGASMSYAKKQANGTGYTTIANCSDAGAVLASGLPSTVTVTAAALTNGTAGSCVFSYGTDTYTGTGIIGVS